ncbi:MAG: ubiquitin-conjugating enzyme E2, partial [archaeon]|nr:ubiquitin-conjugating enzyme E2 [archaeon]
PCSKSRPAAKRVDDDDQPSSIDALPLNYHRAEALQAMPSGATLADLAEVIIGFPISEDQPVSAQGQYLVFSQSSSSLPWSTRLSALPSDPGNHIVDVDYALANSPITASTAAPASALTTASPLADALASSVSRPIFMKFIHRDDGLHSLISKIITRLTTEHPDNLPPLIFQWLSWLHQLSIQLQIPAFSVHFICSSSIDLLFSLMRRQYHAILGDKPEAKLHRYPIYAQHPLLEPLIEVLATTVARSPDTAGALIANGTLHLLLSTLSDLEAIPPQNKEQFTSGTPLLQVLSDLRSSLPAPPEPKRAAPPPRRGGSAFGYGRGGSNSGNPSDTFWNKGTGYGTDADKGAGSNWDPEEHTNVQKLKAELCTKIISFFTLLFSQPGDLSEVIETLKASCFTPFLEQYLRNDSLLEMMRTRELYQSIYLLIQTLARHPDLVSLIDVSQGKSTSIGTLLAMQEGMASLLLSQQDTNGSDTKNDGSSASSSSLMMQPEPLSPEKFSNFLIYSDSDSDSEEPYPGGYTTPGFPPNISNTTDPAWASQQPPEEADDATPIVNQEEVLLAKSIIETHKIVAAAIQAHRQRLRQARLKRSDGLDTEADSEDSNDPMVVYRKTLGPLQFADVEMAGADKAYNPHHYAAQILQDTRITNAKLRRASQELATLRSNMPLSSHSSIFLRVDSKRVDVLRAMITGPTDTPYSFGAFQFDIFLPSTYPKGPPLVNLETTGNGSVRFNPNLYNSGKVCLSLLGTWRGQSNESWLEKESTLLQVLVSIQSLIFVDEPYFNEPGYESEIGSSKGIAKSLEYNRNIRAQTIRWAIIDQLRNPSPGFEDVIRAHFLLKAKDVVSTVFGWIAEEMDRSDAAASQQVSILRALAGELQVELQKLDPSVPLEVPLEEINEKQAEKARKEAEQQKEIEAARWTASYSLQDFVGTHMPLGLCYKALKDANDDLSAASNWIYDQGQQYLLSHPELWQVKPPSEFSAPAPAPPKAPENDEQAMLELALMLSLQENNQDPPSSNSSSSSSSSTAALPSNPSNFPPSSDATDELDSDLLQAIMMSMKDDSPPSSS